MKKSGTLNAEATGEFNNMLIIGAMGAGVSAAHAVLQVQHICTHRNI